MPDPAADHAADPAAATPEFDAPHRGWWRLGVVGGAWSAVFACASLSAWLFVLMPRAVDPESSPFTGAAALTVTALGLAIVAAGALFARGALLLRASPRTGHGPRTAYGTLAVAGAIVALPALRWSWLAWHAIGGEFQETLWSSELDGPVFSALWMETMSWLVVLSIGVVAAPAWFVHRRARGDRDAEVPVRPRGGRVPFWAAACWLGATSALGIWGGTAWVSEPGSMLTSYQSYAEGYCGNGGGGPPAPTPTIAEERALVASVRRVVRANRSPVGRLLTRYHGRVETAAAAWAAFLGEEDFGPSGPERWGMPVRFADTRCQRAVAALPDSPRSAAAVPELLGLLGEADGSLRVAGARGLMVAGRWSEAAVPALLAIIEAGHASDCSAAGVSADPLEAWDPSLWSDFDADADDVPPPTPLALGVLASLARDAQRTDAHAACLALLQHDSRWLRAATLMELQHLTHRAFDHRTWTPGAPWAFEALAVGLTDPDPAIVQQTLWVLADAPWFTPEQLASGTGVWTRRIVATLDPARSEASLTNTLDLLVRLRVHASGALTELLALKRARPDFRDAVIDLLLSFKDRAAGRELLAMLAADAEEEREAIRGRLDAESLHRAGAPGSIHPDDLAAAVQAAAPERHELMLSVARNLGVLPDNVRRALATYLAEAEYPDEILDALDESYAETATARTCWFDAIAQCLDSTQAYTRSSAVGRLDAHWTIAPAPLRQRIRRMLKADPSGNVRNRVANLLWDAEELDRAYADPNDFNDFEDGENGRGGDANGEDD